MIAGIVWSVAIGVLIAQGAAFAKAWLSRKDVIVRDVQLSQRTLRVLKYLAEHPEEKCYSYPISKAVGAGPGTVIAILDRMETQGWIQSRRVVTLHAVPRPRHLYGLTDAGAKIARLTADDVNG